VQLILGSDFTGLTPAATPAVSATPGTTPTTAAPGTSTVSPTPSAPTPSASASGIGSLATANGGITAAASCASDSTAFAGSLTP